MIDIRFFLIFFIIIGNCYAERAENNVDKLSQITTFSSGWNGFAGRQSEGERLYKNIAENPDAEKKFKMILESDFATPEAKLYALCGLKEKNAEISYLLKFHNVDKSVSVLNGDILRKAEFSEVYNNILNNGCDI